jgi:hypothetical protein
LKTVMQMEMLRATTPEMVRKEIGMYFLAYNPIRGLMAEAARDEEIGQREPSFEGALHTARAFEESHLYEAARIAADLPRLVEMIGPKRVGDRPDRYGRGPRNAWAPATTVVAHGANADAEIAQPHGYSRYPHRCRARRRRPTRHRTPGRSSTDGSTRFIIDEANDVAASRPRPEADDPPDRAEVEGAERTSAPEGSGVRRCVTVVVTRLMGGEASSASPYEQERDPMRLALGWVIKNGAAAIGFGMVLTAFSASAWAGPQFAPEIDPGSMANALLALSGGVLIVTGRRPRN